MTYTVFDEGKTHKGDAKQVLEEIRSEGATFNDEIKAMSVEEYADALIEDAPYFLDEDLIKAFEGESFASKFDKALAFLASMPTSGIRILSSR